MDTRTIVIGIALALLIGTGIGYTISPNESLNLEEYQKNLTLLQNNNLELQTALASTESENTELRETLRNAEELFESIEEKLDIFESGFGSPVFDSGWIAIDPGETKSMEHGLGTEEDLFVYVIGRYREGQTNQLYYGLGYLWDVEIGNGWTMDDTIISITRGEADVHWSEIRVYVWRIPQGQADQTASTEAEMDVKYIVIDISGNELLDYHKIIDLDGYREVTISWSNGMFANILEFWWNIEKLDGTYDRVGALFFADYWGGTNLFRGDGYDTLCRVFTGSESFKIGSKYLSIETRYGDLVTENDRIQVIILATK